MGNNLYVMTWLFLFFQDCVFPLTPPCPRLRSPVKCHQGQVVTSFHTKRHQMVTYTLHTVSFDWFLSGLEWILKLEFCLLKLLIFYQKLLWNIRSRLNSSTIWVSESGFTYVWSKSSFFVQKASILIKHI